MKSLILVFIVSFLAFACSNKSGGGGGGGNNNAFGPGNQKGGGNQPFGENEARGETCLFTNGTICAEFIGTQWTSEQIHNVCTYYQGQISQVVCKANNIVAECILNKGLANEALLKYYSPISRDNAAADCNQANGILR